MVERQRGATHAERLTRQPRVDRERSAFLEEQIQGQHSALVDACALLEWELFSDLTPTISSGWHNRATCVATPQAMS